jgi:lysophospholipase L1-like esterase
MKQRAHRHIPTACIMLVLSLLGISCREAMGASLKPIAIEDPARHLQHFYHALHSTSITEDKTITRVIQFGDSHTAADLLTGRMRELFQRDFGDAGTGFIFAGKPWTWYAPRNASCLRSANWSVDGLRTADLMRDSLLGLAGLSFTAHIPNEWTRLTAVGRRFDIYALQGPGCGAVEIKLDGQNYWDEADLNADAPTPANIEIEAESDGEHAIEIRTIAPGSVRIYGMTAERDQAGVTFDALGINGARADRVLAWDESIFSAHLATRNPDLIIVAYGTNEAGAHDFNAAVFFEQFTALLERLKRAVPGASLLVISPPDRAVRSGRRWMTIATLPIVVAAERRAARQAGVAFWDTYTAMGGAGSIAGWARMSPQLAQADRVHLTGTGYRLIAEAIYAELMRGYLASTQTRAQTPERVVQ